MAKLTRKLQDIFGDGAGTSEIGVFGSDSAGLPATSKDLDVIQSLSQFDNGWFSATANAAEPPRLEDRNGLDFLLTAQLKYLFQAGLPEWIATEKYYLDDSFVNLNGIIYQAILGDDVTNDNTNKSPDTNPLWWRIVVDTTIIDPWDVAEAVSYESAGTLVERFGVHYASSGKAANSGKDPVDPQNATWWVCSPGKDKLLEWFNSSRPIFNGMHPSTDYSHADYQQNMLLDTLKLGAETYDFYRVMLDGTVVTGNTTLENDIFDVSGAKEYLWIDEYLPDTLGTRTLIDMRERSTRSIGASGGVAPTIAEVQEDALQGFRVLTVYDEQNTSLVALDATKAIRKSRNTTTDSNYNLQAPNSGTPDADIGLSSPPIDDGSNGVPRIDIETRAKAFVRGVDYIIVMVKQ